MQQIKQEIKIEAPFNQFDQFNHVKSDEMDCGEQPSNIAFPERITETSISEHLLTLQSCPLPGIESYMIDQTASLVAKHIYSNLTAKKRFVRMVTFNISTLEYAKTLFGYGTQSYHKR